MLIQRWARWRFRSAAPPPDSAELPSNTVRTRLAEAPAARALYAGLGFRAYGTEAHGLKLGPGRYLDEVLMALDLRGG